MTPRPRTLALVPPGHCHACGQRLPEARRICAACRQPIRRSHRYRFAGGEVRHLNCESPETPPQR